MLIDNKIQKITIFTEFSVDKFKKNMPPRVNSAKTTMRSNKQIKK